MAWYEHLIFWRRRPKRRKRRRRPGKREVILRAEAEAIDRLATIFETLPSGSRERVLTWLGSVYGEELAGAADETPNALPHARAEEAAESPTTPAVEVAMKRTEEPTRLVVAVPSTAPPPRAHYRDRRRKTNRTKF